MKLIFRRREMPIDVRSRISWRTSYILLLIWLSRGKKSSLQRLHILHTIYDNNYDPTAPSTEWIRFDPSINSAIDYNMQSGLVTFSKGRYSVTEKGLVFCNQLKADSDIKILTSTFANITKQVTEEVVKSLMKGML